MARALDAVKPGKPHFTDIKDVLSLIDLIVGAFSGALIGVAVTNRAMRLNSEALRALRARADRYAKDAEKMKEALQRLGPNPSNADDVEKQRLAQQMLVEATMDLRENLEEQRKFTL
jgi:hypothetical protein